MNRQTRIEDKLRSALSPAHLEVVNESSMHAVPPDSETHFKVVVVAKAFENKASVMRHQLVYAALGDELKRGLHALAITARTPEEWSRSPEAHASPLCHGGSRADTNRPKA